MKFSFVEVPSDYYLGNLLSQLNKCLEAKPADKAIIQMGKLNKIKSVHKFCQTIREQTRV